MQRSSHGVDNGVGGGGGGVAGVAGGAGVHPACASCKHQRKKCSGDCVLAPYFPADRKREFQAVHRMFGVSNVMKLVRGVDEQDRKSVADSLVWEAICRENDPVLGSLGEYRKVQEELRFYKAAQEQNSQLLVQQQSRMVAWNVQNNPDSSIVLNYNNSENVSRSNRVVDIVDSYPLYNPAPLCYDVGLPEKNKHEKENVFHHQHQQQQQPMQPQQQQQLYIPGQFGARNGKTMHHGWGR